MYFADLTPYAYRPDIADERLVNFGWLENGQPFERGPMDAALFEQLARGVASFVNAYRGVHVCDFCGFDSLDRAAGASELFLGHAEVWIPAPDGRVFIAPTLVHHYVTAHEYIPPPPVLDALRALPADVAAWDTPDGYFRRLVARLEDY